MVWSCFFWNGLDNLVEIDGIVTANSYIDMLNENLGKHCLKMDLIFQQDNNPKHTAKITKQFLNASSIEVLE